MKIALLPIVIASAALGCGSPAPAKVVTPTPQSTLRADSNGDGKGDRGSQALIERRTSAMDEDAAVGELAEQLAAELVGEIWTPLFLRTPMFGTDWATWLTRNGAVRADPNTGSFTAKLAASQIANALDEFAEAPLALDALQLPSTWRSAVEAALLAERRWLVCQRKQQWLGRECTVQPPLDERVLVSNLSSGLTLESVFPEGIPVRQTGEAVWPVELRVVQRVEGQLQTLEGVPVEWAAADGAPLRVASDANGVCHFSRAPLTVGGRIRVAASALLGPLAELLDASELAVPVRPLDFARHAAIEVNNRSASSLALQAPSSLLHRELSAAFGKPPLAVPQDLARELQFGAGNSAGLSAPIRERVIISTRGALDYVVLVATTSEFASQMGSDRTWYEAVARVKVLEVWSGSIVTEFEEKSMGSGLGDAAADEAARRATSHQVARRLRGLQNLP